MTTALLPLAYGYLRDDLLRDPDSSEDRLRAASRSLGYELGTIFHERAPQSGTLPPVFVDLVQECRRSQAHTVLTLRGHLSMPMCRTVLLRILAMPVGVALQEIEP